MKITKAEKIWLGLAVLFFVLYNIPGLPAYGNSVGLIIHGALTVIPLWIVVLVGYSIINRKYRLKGAAKGEDTAAAKSAEDQGGDK